MSSKKPATNNCPAPFNNPFAALQKLKGLPQGEATDTEPAEQAAPKRAVVRYERKGHGGKEVTLVEKLEIDLETMQEWTRALKSSLGCGGVVLDNVIVLQGDQRERVKDWLLRRGLKNVTVC